MEQQVILPALRFSKIGIADNHYRKQPPKWCRVPDTESIDHDQRINRQATLSLSLGLMLLDAFFTPP